VRISSESFSPVHKVHNIGVAEHIGRYSDAIESTSHLRWLHTSGTPGLPKAGELPKDMTSQARLAWQHIPEMLERANMTLADLVKVTQYLTNSKDVPAYIKVRSEILGDVRPVFMLLVVTELIRPEVLVEVEVFAADE
jgi:2-iminobutanoate/2-iminopropanoate deaminase